MFERTKQFIDKHFPMGDDSSEQLLAVQKKLAEAQRSKNELAGIVNPTEGDPIRRDFRSPLDNQREKQLDEEIAKMKAKLDQIKAEIGVHETNKSGKSGGDSKAT